MGHPHPKAAATCPGRDVSPATVSHVSHVSHDEGRGRHPCHGRGGEVGV